MSRSIILLLFSSERLNQIFILIRDNQSTMITIVLTIFWLTLAQNDTRSTGLEISHSRMLASVPCDPGNYCTACDDVTGCLACPSGACIFRPVWAPLGACRSCLGFMSYCLTCHIDCEPLTCYTCHPTAIMVAGFC